MNISIHSGENHPQWLILWECVILPPPVRLFNVCQTFGSSGDPPVDFRKRLLQKGRFGNPMFLSGAGHFMTDDFSGKCMEKMERKSLIPGNHCLLQLIASQAEGPHLGQIPWRSHPKPSWWEVTPALCCPWYVMRSSHPKLPQSQHLASGGVPCFIPTDVQSTNLHECCILKSPTNLYNHPFLWLVVDLISRLQFWIWGYQPTQPDNPKIIQKTDVEFMSPSPPFLLGITPPCSPSRAPWLRLPQCHGHRQRQMWPKFCRRVQDFWTEVHKMRKSIYKFYIYVEVPWTLTILYFVQKIYNTNYHMSKIFTNSFFVWGKQWFTLSFALAQLEKAQLCQRFPAQVLLQDHQRDYAVKG